MSKQKSVRTINISGTIVGADWDAFLAFWPEFAAAYTSESAFIRELQAAADAGEDVRVRVNSWGGEVFAERNMLDAFHQFAGGKSIHVAGMAMSAASDFVLKGGVPVSASEGAVLMFHSATSFTWGGPEAMRDEADLLDQINASSRDALLAHGVPEERVRAAFAEGRMLTMLASEAAKYGIVGEVAGARDADPAKPDRNMIKNAGPDALGKLPKQGAERFAALCQLADEDGGEYAAAQNDPPADGGGVQDSATQPEDKPAEQTAPADGGGVQDPATETTEPSTEPTADAAAAPVSPAAASPAHADGAAPSSDPAALVADLEKQRRAIQSAAAKKHAELTARAEKAEKALADATAERDALAAKLAEVTAALERERTARADLVANVLAPESDTETPASATPHLDRYAALPTLAERLAYAEAHRREIAAETAAYRRR